MSSDGILTIAIACLTCQDHILLLRRYKEPFKDQWSLPGGKIRFGEYVDQAALREIREETGLSLAVLRYLGGVCEQVISSGPGQDILYQHLIYVFRSEINEMKELDSPEGLLCWFKTGEVLRLGTELVSTDACIISELLIKGRSGLYNSKVLFHNGQYECLSFAPV